MLDMQLLREMAERVDDLWTWNKEYVITLDVLTCGIRLTIKGKDEKGTYSIRTAMPYTTLDDAGMLLFEEHIKKTVRSLLSAGKPALITKKPK